MYPTAPLDPEGLRLAPSPTPAARVELPTHRRRQRGRFVPPIPLGWFGRACQLPGKAAVLAAAVWFQAKRRGADTFVLTQAGLAEFGVSRQAKYRGLAALEAAGLVRVRRRRAKSPEVTLLHPDGPAPTARAEVAGATQVPEPCPTPGKPAGPVPS